MKDFYLNSIRTKKEEHEEIYEKVIQNVFGKTLEWDELEKQNKDLLMQVMLELSTRIRINSSPYDITKLTRAIQHSRSGGGGSAMTDFDCAFCGKTETWVNTAVPQICSECAKDMATKIVLQNIDITKSKGEGLS